LRHKLKKLILSSFKPKTSLEEEPSDLTADGIGKGGSMNVICFNVNYDDYDGVVQTTVKSLCAEGKAHITHERIENEDGVTTTYKNFRVCDGSCRPMPEVLRPEISTIVERALSSGFESVKDTELEVHDDGA